MKQMFLHFEIWGWIMKNSRIVYLSLTFLMIAAVPIVGGIFLRGTEAGNEQAAYDYVIFIIMTLISVLGVVPFLLGIHSYYHMESSECIYLSPVWSDWRQFAVNELFCSGVICVMMLVVGLEYASKIGVRMIIRSLIDFIIILFILNAVAHLIVKIFRQIYFTLILTELYAVTFWLLRLFPSIIFNVYSLYDTDGLKRLFHIGVYLTVGCFMEFAVCRIHRIRYPDLVKT